jgi:hypothetical protein
VEFKGNGYTSRETVEISLLRRCAELTSQSGYDFLSLLTKIRKRGPRLTAPQEHSLRKRMVQLLRGL